MLLLVGLGNPNPNNTNNRHNVGFLVIDAINAKFKLSKQKPKFKGLLTTGKINEQKVYAIKPLTFMNSSGICIREIIEYFKINVKDVFVFHDDMDIDIGKIKVKFGGGNAGHNGIESIDKNIGKDYSRIRIGIGRPKNNSTGADHVLDNFSNDEKQSVEEVTNNIIKSLSILIKKDFDLAWLLSCWCGPCYLGLYVWALRATHNRRHLYKRGVKCRDSSNGGCLGS